MNVAFDLRRALFDRLQRQGLAFFGQHTVGDMMTRAVSDIGVLRRLVSLGTIFLVIMVYATAVGFAAMFYLPRTWLGWSSRPCPSSRSTPSSPPGACALPPKPRRKR